jgi:hypothetical protein
MTGIKHRRLLLPVPKFLGEDHVLFVGGDDLAGLDLRLDPGRYLLFDVCPEDSAVIYFAVSRCRNSTQWGCDFSIYLITMSSFPMRIQPQDNVEK